MAIIAEYLFNEAASGSAAANLLDASGNGNHLPISYNTDDIVYSSDAAGRGWQLAGVLSASNAGAFEDVQNAGFNALEASTGFGLILKVTDLNAPTNTGEWDGSPFFHIGIPGSTSFIRLQYNGGYVWQFFWKEVEGYFYGTDVIGIDIDTTQGTASARAVLYGNGNVDNWEEGGPTITQNDALTGAGGSTVDVAVGNSVNANKNPTNAFIKYLAISDTPFGSTVHASTAAALATDDDTALFAVSAAPTLTAGPTITDIVAGGFTVNGTADQNCTVSVVVVDYGDPAPSSGDYDASAFTESATADTPFAVEVTL